MLCFKRLNGILLSKDYLNSFLSFLIISISRLSQKEDVIENFIKLNKENKM